MTDEMFRAWTSKLSTLGTNTFYKITYDVVNGAEGKAQGFPTCWSQACTVWPAAKITGVGVDTLNLQAARIGEPATSV